MHLWHFLDAAHENVTAEGNLVEQDDEPVWREAKMI